MFIIVYLVFVLFSFNVLLNGVINFSIFLSSRFVFVCKRAREWNISYSAADLPHIYRQVPHNTSLNERGRILLEN